MKRHLARTLQTLARQERPPREQSKSTVDLLLIGLFLLLGLTLRLSYLHELRQQPDFDTPLLDGALYDYWARGIAFDEWTCPPRWNDPEIRTSPYCRPPGYPYFLASIYVVTGGSYLAVRLVQMSIGLASALLAYFLARQLFGRLTGLIACFFMSTYWVFIFYEGELNTPPLVVFLLLLLMLTVGKWLTNRTRFSAALVGLSCGVLAQFRPEFLTFIPLLIGWMCWTRLTRMKHKALLLDTAVLLAGCTAIVAPAVIRNYLVSGEFLFCTSGGINLYACNNEDADGVWPVINFPKVLDLDTRTIDNNAYPQYVRALRRKLNDESISFSDTSRYFTCLALSYIYQHPGRTLQLLGKKALLFWGPMEVANNKEIHYAKQFSTTLRYLPGFPFIVALFVLGLFALWRYPPDVPAPARGLVYLLLLYVGVTCFTVLCFMAVARFRVPVIPFMIILGAVGLSTLIQSVARRNAKAVASLVAVYGIALGIFSVNFTHYSPSLAQWYSQLGSVYRTKGDLRAAEEALRKAQDTADPRWPVLDFMGQVLLQQGRPQDALECFEKAMANPTMATSMTCTNAGFALQQMGRIDEAISMYRKALAMDEKCTLARMNLGTILIAKKEYAAATAEFERLLSDGSLRRHALHNLAWIAELAGRRAEAKLKYEEVLAEFPDYAQSHNNLGYILQQEGKPTEARAHYETAIRANPDYQLARENLAILLRDSGAIDEAIVELREILRIDPQNPFAQTELQKLGADR